MLSSSIIASSLASRVKAQARMATQKSYYTVMLLESSQKLQKGRTEWDCLRLTAEQLNRMDETLLRRRQMAERHDAHGVDETEQQFYDLLARAAGNPLLTDLHHALAHSLRTRTAPSGSQPETDDDLQAMYENLVRQITEQNAKKSGKIAQNIRTAHH